MGLFAMPVIYSDRDSNQIVGESYFIELGPNDRFGWTEPDGKVYQIAAANLETLKRRSTGSVIFQASGEMTGYFVGWKQADRFYDHARSTAGVWHRRQRFDRVGS